LWIVDFFLELYGDGMGRTAQQWSYGDVVFWFSVNLHAILIPISFYAVWKLGFDKKVLSYVLSYAFLLLVVTYLTTEPVENRNCVFYGCDFVDPGGGYLKYFVLEFLIPWQLIFIASFFVQKKFFSLIKKKK
jgi:purine-cytosine permease-like protein